MDRKNDNPHPSNEERILAEQERFTTVKPYIERFKAQKGQSRQKLTLITERTLSRRRSYSITFRNQMIDKIGDLGFTESIPLTITNVNNNTGQKESYVRLMGKITGNTHGRSKSMVFSLGSDLADLHNWEVEERVQLKIFHNRIDLEFQNNPSCIIITPGIDKNQTYVTRRLYSQSSDYVNNLSRKEIILMEIFGFKQSETVNFQVIKKGTSDVVEEFTIKLGRKRKVGKKAEKVKLSLPLEMVERYAIGDSVLIKISFEPKRMILTPMSIKNPLKENGNFNYYFTISKLNIEGLGTTQKSLQNINRFYMAYLGYEFERIGQSVLKFLYPSGQIYFQREFRNNQKDGRMIRPDATILEHGKPMTFVDFKKSIGAIRGRTLNYLKLYPDSRLILCILEDFGWSWKEKYLKNKIVKQNIDIADINAVLERITILDTSDMMKRLPEKIQTSFKSEITQLMRKFPRDQIDALHKSKELILEVKNKFINSDIPQEAIIKLINLDRGIISCINTLHILKSLYFSDYVTAKDFLTHETISAKENANTHLRQLEELGLAKSKPFRIGLANRKYYYYYTKKEPVLMDVVSPDIAFGLKTLINHNYISNKDYTESTLKEEIGSNWYRTLKTAAILNEKRIGTIDDIRAEFGSRRAIYSLQKLGAVDFCQIYRERNDKTVVYFFVHEFPYGLPLIAQIPYLKLYQRKTIKEIVKITKKIPDVQNFKDWLGDNWPVVLKSYYFILNNEKILKSLNNNVKVLYSKDLCQMMNVHPNIMWKVLNKLNDIGLLDKYPWLEKSSYFQIKGTDPILLTNNPLLQKEILKPLRTIEQISKIQFRDVFDLRNRMTRHWQTTIRLFTIISDVRDVYDPGISRKDLIQLLKKNEMVFISRISLARAIKPLKDIGLLISYKKGRHIFYQLLELDK